MKTTESVTIHHYNKLDGVDRILSDLYNYAILTSEKDTHDPYVQGLLKAIVAVKAAQRHLDWTPYPAEMEEDGALTRQI